MNTWKIKTNRSYHAIVVLYRLKGEDVLFRTVSWVLLRCDVSCTCREKDLDNKRGEERYSGTSIQRGRQSGTNLLGRQKLNRPVYLEQDDMLRSSCQKSLGAKLKYMNE